ncbi:response regulator [Maribacter sp. 2307ULW6-5]|uniref:response regulator n=1 Tax=Maribacter sp. 2307ULW6-5 TaxID=3386275 RepID=UPI0039BCF72D
MSKPTYLVFLADDDADDRQFLIDAFQELPDRVKVTTFDNGVELMDALLHTKPLPQMVFLDLFMPLMNGEECLHDIRNEAALAAIPVVIYSTMLDPDKAADLKEQGANKYLQKPASFEALKQALTVCLDYIEQRERHGNDPGEYIIKQ